jgi:hypothetical protein
MSNKKYNSYEMYWSDSLKNSKICPNCGTVLNKDYQTYLVAVYIKKESDLYATGNSGGYFCPNCPVVVLDKATFEEAVTVVAGTRNLKVNSFEFAVLGLVDYDAIPEDEGDEEFGAENNPLPLIQFKDRSKKNPARNTKSSSSRKIGRNDPCPCGSGKKYKKCCGRRA